MSDENPDAVANCLCHDISGRCTLANCGERSRHHGSCVSQWRRVIHDSYDEDTEG